jgi:hypothetical protein
MQSEENVDLTLMIEVFELMYRRLKVIGIEETLSTLVLVMPINHDKLTLLKLYRTIKCFQMFRFSR